MHGKRLTIDHLLQRTKKHFNSIKEEPENKISTSDCLLSGLAIFGLKYPSLLQFDNDRKNNEPVIHNLKNLYKISQVPSDTYLRERLDEIEPAQIRGAFKKNFALIQRNKVLEPYVFIEGHYLVAVDGTGVFSSKNIHCGSCCVNHHRDGTLSYNHKMIGAVLMHPDHKEVFPFAPEAITKQDGSNKNDCEQVAGARLLKDLRREHPHLKVIIVQDALTATGPNIRLLQSLEMKFIIGAKQLAADFEYIDQEKILYHELPESDGRIHRFRFVNDIGLNGSNLDLKVNLLDYREISSDGAELRRFTWVTDIHLNSETVYKVMRGGRARWKVENETFNTLKNQGYHFEHNFGHGYKHLSTVFANLMFLAFFIDQVQQRCCKKFQTALTEAIRHIRFWKILQRTIFEFFVESWDSVYEFISNRKKYRFSIPATNSS